MQFGVVMGTVVATKKLPSMTGFTLRLVQREDHDGRALGGLEVAVDTVRSALGQRVVLVGSREAAIGCTPSFVPVDLAIVGIVDDAYREVGL
ncbi:MAG: ethanolamine utilization protein EutN [Myxococcales bacterium]|nr:ethanolamine utilization protein EutN [Myxococcales bacterium]|tara:strand:- start:228 stop:503 length:276 start_codon:yes stop_codon:yes gene_type:complete